MPIWSKTGDHVKRIMWSCQNKVWSCWNKRVIILEQKWWSCKIYTMIMSKQKSVSCMWKQCDHTGTKIQKHYYCGETFSFFFGQVHFQKSPWYNRTGWLGVKHQLTYLLFQNSYPGTMKTLSETVRWYTVMIKFINNIHAVPCLSGALSGHGCASDLLV